jgi:hypothetical protein
MRDLDLQADDHAMVIGAGRAELSRGAAPAGRNRLAEPMGGGGTLATVAEPWLTSLS